MKLLQVVKRAAWRRWPGANGSSAKEIWLVFYKKHAGKKRLAELAAAMSSKRKLVMK